MISIFEVFIISVGLAMDACAVSISKGLSIGRFTFKEASVVALYFGMFQGLMPLIGFFTGKLLPFDMQALDHWFALLCLAIIGIKNLKTAMSKEESEDSSLGPFSMIPLAFATSIDAFAVGFSLSMFKMSIFSTVSIIALVTFLLCIAGFRAGVLVGSKYRSKAEILGAIVLMAIGTKIFIEHILKGI